jgi:Flp pilus assembly pilin Flp
MNASKLRILRFLPIALVMKRAGNERHCRGRRSGQALVEYALVLAFLTSFCIAVLTPWGAPLRGLYLYIIDAVAATAASIS